MNLDEFLLYEKKHDLLKYKFEKNGYCIWPFIRYQVASYLIMGQNSSISAQYDPRFQGNSIIGKAIPLISEYIRTFLPSKKKGKVRKCKIVIFASDASDIPSKEGWFNRCLDVFAECRKDCSQMILLTDRTVRYPRKFEHYYFYVRNEINKKILAHIRPISNTDEKTIDLLIKELEEAFPSIKDYLQGRIRSILYRKSRTLDFEIKHFNKIIRGKYTITSFAHPLKRTLAALLNISIDKFEDRNFKERTYIYFPLLYLTTTPESDKILSDNKFSKAIAIKDFSFLQTYYITIRQLLQCFGTEIMRGYFGDNL